MIYLSPQLSANRAETLHGNWGVITAPSRWGLSTIRDGTPWAADNGAFTGKFQPEWFYDWLLDMRTYVATCLFVASPDRVSDAAETMRLYAIHAPLIRSLGYPVAFVAQDGQQAYELPDDYDALFVGGTTDWKLGPSADACIYAAKRTGRWVHVGRVNTQRRIRHFQRIGADSVDGTSVCFGPDKNYPVIDAQLAQPVLFVLEEG
jgi:hypothetical protein